jgi:hypothetical protein
MKRKLTKTERENARIRKVHDALDRAERRLIRAQNAWQRAREAVIRLDKRMEKNLIGGTYDVRELMNDSAGAGGNGAA